MRHDDEIDDDERKRVLKDGERLRVALTAMDATRKAVVAADGDPLSLHKPGYRVSTDRAVQDARDQAYDEMVKAAGNSWKSEAQRIADAECAAEPPLCQDSREDAYQRHKNRMANAWRGAR
jgi:hypothetical protein